jgi:hypothetical protein
MEVKLDSGFKITIKIIDASRISVTHNCDKITTITNKNKIEQLIFTDNYRIKLGDTLEIQDKINNLIYFVGNIRQTSNLGYVIEAIVKNKSSTFIVPLISNNNNNSSFMYDTYFYNSYMYKDGFDIYNNGEYIFLKYRFFISDYYYEFEKFLTSLPTFIKSVQEDKDFTIYIFTIPEQFKKDVRLIMKGKYSHISSTAKSKIIMFHRCKVFDPIPQILNKDPKLKAMMEEELDCIIPNNVDLLDKPNVELERLY